MIDDSHVKTPQLLPARIKWKWFRKGIEINLFFTFPSRRIEHVSYGACKARVEAIVGGIERD